MTQHHWRKLVNGLMFSVTAACALAAVCVLFWILGFLVWNGGRALVVRYTADLLNGVPSIVMGIFAYAMVVRPLHQFSALAGGVALSVILIPTTIRTTEQFLRAVPLMLREGALALGASKWKSIATIVVPAAIRGVATGMILGIARIAGESAPLLFTSFGNQYWSRSLSHPTASLPVMIFTYAISPYA